ncbi:pitrilysin family protein [Pelomonas sp. KK5]|uniref:M16 family metallopeptidase n=1 Tax=Pelomonas sp. KK5 TaxID=1855730 RepID=UPI001E359AB5|nr:pitrilysin family protein [Pelomonas sp. KK5]
MQDQPIVTTLPNGLRAVAIPMPWRSTVSLSVFIRTGSLHESARLNGISHVVEHMAFKGTATRDCQQINLDAERLGAEVNAHTDKDHTAFHLEGLPQDLPAFVAMLADVVLAPSFPAEELERERGVIEQEFGEYEDDPVTQAFQLFDRACYGLNHPAGQPVIGKRANLKRFTREDLLAYVQRQYSAANVVVAAAGAVDVPAFTQAVEEAFGAMPAGSPHEVAPPDWQGGLKQRRMAGSGQCQIVIGYPSPALGEPGQATYAVAAALLGEGMSSPLLDEIRERRGLAYHVGCSADAFPLCGQLLVEAATTPEQAEELIVAVHELLQRHAGGAVDPVGLERARAQLSVRALRAQEQPTRRIENAAQDLFRFGHLREARQWLDELQAVSADAVREVFVRMAAQRPAIALAGSVPGRLRERAEALFGLG